MPVDAADATAPIALEPEHASRLGTMTPVEEAVDDIWRALFA